LVSFFGAEAGSAASIVLASLNAAVMRVVASSAIALASVSVKVTVFVFVVFDRVVSCSSLSLSASFSLS